MNLKDLVKPFAAHEVKWRVGQLSANKKSATLLCYIDARAAMDRLDEVCSPENWGTQFLPHPLGGVMCLLSIQVAPGEWVTKSDGAEATKIHGTKGGTSDALKRAAVQWGIFRYGYSIESKYHKILPGYGGDDDIYQKLNSEPGHIKRPQLQAKHLPVKLAAVPAPQRDYAKEQGAKIRKIEDHVDTIDDEAVLLEYFTGLSGAERKVCKDYFTKAKALLQAEAEPVGRST